jgi:kanamycin nucleotidyltransferase
MPGPQPLLHEERLAIARRLAERLGEVYGDTLLAIGVYGSVASGADGPFSDIELWCVVRAEGVDTSHEWVAGAWKAQVDVMSADKLIAVASEVDENWALTHGAFERVLPLHDPTGFFTQLRAAATGQSDDRFRAAVEATLVGDIYEDVGKLRNARWRGETASLPLLAVDLARYGALVLGLHTRRTFSTSSRVLREALRLPDRPAGFDALANLVMRGDLADQEAVHAICEAFWVGLCAWADRHEYRIVTGHTIPF